MNFCRHKHTTTPRHDEEGDYTRCLDCGARIPFKQLQLEEEKQGGTIPTHEG